MERFDEPARESGNSYGSQLKPSSKKEDRQNDNLEIPKKDPYDAYLEDMMMNEGCPNGS